MLMINYQINIDAYVVYDLDIYFLKAIRQLWLVNEFLHGVKIELQRLVLSVDRAP